MEAIADIVYEMGRVSVVELCRAMSPVMPSQTVFRAVDELIREGRIAQKGGEIVYNYSRN